MAESLDEENFWREHRKELVAGGGALALMGAIYGLASHRLHQKHQNVDVTEADNPPPADAPSGNL